MAPPTRGSRAERGGVMSCPLGPCICMLCRHRYLDVSTCADRLSVTAGEDSRIKVSGRCTRCHQPLGDAAFLVNDTVAWRIVRDIAMTQREAVLVCTHCATDQEISRHAAYGLIDRCLNCQRKIRVAVCGHKGGCPKRPFCDNACYRQHFRKKRRSKNMFCTVCNIGFAASRKDARFCSDACRQWAYRRRAA